jgi:hypothetical protein
VVLRLEVPRAEAPAHALRLEAGLFALALGVALLALCADRSDLDDAFYVNLAVAAARRCSPPIPCMASPGCRSTFRSIASTATSCGTRRLRG